MKVVTSALVIIPPEEFCTQINLIRSDYDKAYPRWMPHINILYPFIPRLEYKKYLKEIENALSKVEPFEIDLVTLDHFKLGSSYTLHLVPEPKKQLNNVQKILFDLFPFCDDLSKKSDTGYQGHLTVAQSTTAGLKNLKAKINDTINLSTWKVDEVCLIARSVDSQFEIEHRIKLGTKIPLKPAPKPKPDSTKNQAKPDDPQSPAENPAKTPEDKGPAFPSKIPENIPPPQFNFSTQNYFPKILKRFLKWTQKRKRSSSLPKTKEKLINSIKPLCLFRIPVISAEYVYARLYEQNYIDIDDDEELILVNRKFDGFPNLYKEPNHWTKDLNELQVNAVTKCFNWISTLDSAPGSFWALRHSIDQLCLGRGEIDPTTFVEYLCEKKIIVIDQKDNNVTYKIDNLK